MPHQGQDRTSGVVRVAGCAWGRAGQLGDVVFQRWEPGLHPPSPLSIQAGPSSDTGNRKAESVPTVRGAFAWAPIRISPQLH